METIINLKNNFYLKVIDDVNNLPEQVINIETITSKDLKKEKILLKLDFNTLEENKYKKIIKKLLFIESRAIKKKIEIGSPRDSKILLGYVINYNESNKHQNDFISAINAVFCNTRYERYNYIYDEVCDYLDSFFYGKNLCDFKDNKCGEKRNTSSNVGCCHHYKNKILGPLLSNNLIPCEYLKEDHSCGAKCISCKLFTCDYLEKKGIKFRIRDIFLLDTFFNPLQKYFIKTMVFNPKNKIINRLLKL